MKAEAIRFPSAIRDSIQEEIDMANAEAGWEKFTLSDLVRDLVQEAIEERRRRRITAAPSADGASDRLPAKLPAATPRERFVERDDGAPEPGLDCADAARARRRRR